MNSEVLDGLWSRRLAVIQRLQSGKNGLARYEQTQTRLSSTNVAADSDYQRGFNAFYRMRQRTKAWYKHYFTFLEKRKADKQINFLEVLTQLSEFSGQLEASFSSKLFATIRPEMPVFDSEIGRWLHVALPPRQQPLAVRVSAFDHSYQKLTADMNALLANPQFKELKELFDRELPFDGFTDMKKLDLLLWADRD